MHDVYVGRSAEKYVVTKGQCAAMFTSSLCFLTDSGMTQHSKVSPVGLSTCAVRLCVCGLDEKRAAEYSNMREFNVHGMDDALRFRAGQ